MKDVIWKSNKEDLPEVVYDQVVEKEFVTVRVDSATPVSTSYSEVVSASFSPPATSLHVIIIAPRPPPAQISESGSKVIPAGVILLVRCTVKEKERC